MRPSRAAKNTGESGIRQRRMDVRASFDQQLDDRSVTIRGGPHESRLSATSLALRQRLAGAAHLLDRPCQCAPRSSIQFLPRKMVFGSAPRSSSSRQWIVPVLAGERQWSDAVTIRHPHVRTSVGEEFRGFEIVEVNAQCSAVIPSACGAFTSACCLSSVRMLARSCFPTASANRDLTLAADWMLRAHRHPTAQIVSYCCHFSPRHELNAVTWYADIPQATRRPAGRHIRHFSHDAVEVRQVGSLGAGGHVIASSMRRVGLTSHAMIWSSGTFSRAAAAKRLLRKVIRNIRSIFVITAFLSSQGIPRRSTCTPNCEAPRTSGRYA